MNALLAGLCGIGVAMGLWLTVLTIRGTVVVGVRADGSSPKVLGGFPFLGPTGSGGPVGPLTRAERAHPKTLLFAAVAMVAAIAVLLSTRLVVGAVAAGFGVMLIPQILQARAERERAIAKMRAAAEFVEAIRGSLGAGSGLEAAIVESAMRPPEALEVELAAFLDHVRLPDVTTERALIRLAEDVGEPAIDLLVGSLLAALRGAAGDMGQLFERIAEQGRAFADTRSTTQAERSKVEFQTKVLSLLVIAVALLSVFVSPDLTEAYGPTVGGQLLLLVPLSVFGFGWWWLLRMNRVESLYRFRLRGVEPA